MNIKQTLDDLCAAGDLATQGDVEYDPLQIDEAIKNQSGTPVIWNYEKNCISDEDGAYVVKAFNSRQAIKALRDLLEPVKGLEGVLNRCETGIHAEGDKQILIEAAKRFQAMQGGV